MEVMVMAATGAPSAVRSELAEVLGTVEEAMTRSVVSVSRDMPASEAVTYLYRRGVGGAPVVEEGRVVGVVTIADLTAPHPYARETGPFLRPHHGGHDWQVGDLMTQSPVTVSPEAPLVEAVVTMARGHIDRLPVVDRDGGPIGIVARDDVVRVLARVAARTEQRAEARSPVLLPD
jgi:CBS domain-containing protein